MKRLSLLLLLVCLSGVAMAQKLKGPFRIPFGSSRDEVVSTMSKKGFADVDSRKEEVIYFDKVTYGKFKGCFVAFRFISDKLYAVRVYVYPKNESELIDLYDEVYDELSYVYQSADSVVKSANSYDDEKILEELKKNTAKYFSVWNKKELQGELSCEINNGKSILIYYGNSAVQDEEKKKKDAKIKADY